MRNPWGSSEWTGPWSDASDLWTDETRELCGMTEKDDGVFFIPFEDYVRHFATTSICVDADPEEFHHSCLLHDMSDCQSQDFTFELSESVPADEVFTISVAQ